MDKRKGKKPMVKGDNHSMNATKSEDRAFKKKMNAKNPHKMGKSIYHPGSQMPYKSKAQQRLFHAKEARGEISHKVVKEYDRATNFKKLPERKKKQSEDSKFAKRMKGKR